MIPGRNRSSASRLRGAAIIMAMLLAACAPVAEPVYTSDGRQGAEGA